LPEENRSYPAERRLAEDRKSPGDDQRPFSFLEEL